MFNAASKYVRKLIKDRKWNNIRFNVKLYQTRKEAVLRNQDWLEYGFSLLNIHRQWLQDIRINKLPQTSEAAFAHFLISLYLHSGVCHTKYLLAIAKDISNNDIMIHLFGKLPYIQVSLDAKIQGYTNAYSTSAEKIYIRKIFLSPISLHLLNHYMKLHSSNNKLPDSQSQLKVLLYKYLKPYDKQFLYDDIQVVRRYKEITQNNIHLVLQKSILVLENMGVRLSQPLVHYAIDSMPSSCLPNYFYESLDNNSPSPFHITNSVVNSIKTHNNNTTTAPTPNFYTLLATAMKRQSSSKKLTSTKLREQLEQLKPVASTFAEQWLLEWYIDLLKHNNAASSIVTYHSRVSRRWLCMTANKNILKYTSENFEDLYLRIDSSVKKGNEYVFARLMQLHQFGVDNYSVESLSDDFGQDTNAEKHIRSGFVTEPLFAQMLNEIDAIEGTNDDIKRAIKAVLIICYRCGLRISEAIKIRSQDICKDTNTTWIYVRANAIGDNKTYHSYRKVPLSIMLLKAEKDIINKCIEKTTSPSHLVFSVNNMPLNKSLISAIAKYYLCEISGKPYFVQHHLRHSCLSRLQLMSLGETKNTLPDFIPYEAEEKESEIEQNANSDNEERDLVEKEKTVQQILSIIEDKNEYTTYALSKFAGHADPSITYRHYYHFSSYALGKAIIDAPFLCDKTLANSLFGIGRRRFAKHNTNSKLLEFTIKNCTILHKPPRKKKKDTRNTSLIPHKKSSTRTFDMSVVNEILIQYHDEPHTFESLVALHNCQKNVPLWLSAAEKIKSRYTTRNGTSRLFSKKRSNHLAPQPLSSQTDKEYCEYLIRKIHTVWGKMTKPKRKKLLKILDYTLRNISTSQSGIHFTDPNIFEEYIQTLQPFIPLSLWVATPSCIIGSTRERRWHNVLKDIEVDVEKRVSTSSKGRKATGQVQLQLLNKASNFTPKQTNVLIYFFHMMAIMMWDDETMKAVISRLPH